VRPHEAPRPEALSPARGSNGVDWRVMVGRGGVIVLEESADFKSGVRRAHTLTRLLRGLPTTPMGHRQGTRGPDPSADFVGDCGGRWVEGLSTIRAPP